MTDHIKLLPKGEAVGMYQARRSEMTQHTPGPWTIANYPHTVAVQMKSHKKTAYGASRYAAIGGFDRSDPEQMAEAQANARLIAAAPELLEALTEIVAAADGGGWKQLDPSFATARAAIAKATRGRAMTDRQTTHAPGCWSWGPKHYECAVGMIERLQAEVKQLQADLEESDEIREKLGYLLTRTAAALKGEPPEKDHETHENTTDAPLMMNKSIPEAVLEAVARAICVACEENPDRRGDARGNKFRWQDYRDVALAAISAFTTAQQPTEGEEVMVNTPHGVFILPLHPSGLSSGPRFVVYVPELSKENSND